MEDGNADRHVCKDYCGYHWRGILILMVPLILLPIPILGKSSEYSCVYVIIVLGVYWATESIPIYATALFPIVVLPLLGVLDSDVVCKQYIRDSIFLFFGGIVVALAFEFSNLHKRLALRTMLIAGCNPNRLQFAIIVFTALVSMCLNNVATTLMMVPIVNVILEELEAQGISKQYTEPIGKDVENKNQPAEQEAKTPSNTTTSFYLSVAYAATLGGTLTLVGSVTNLVYKEILDKRFPKGADILHIYSILAYTAPFVIAQLIFVYFYLQWMHMGLFRKDTAQQVISKDAEDAGKAKIKERLAELGSVTIHEWQILILFILMVLLLFSREPGWINAFPEKGIFDAWPVILVLIALFMIPLNYQFLKYCFGSAPFTNKPTPSLISWKIVHTKVPWGLIFLIGAGYALQEAINQSKLAEKLSYELRALENCPSFVIQIVCVFITLAATSLCSNVIVCSVLVPLYAELARVCNINPLNLILPAGVASSMAFLLPMSTPPNAIVSNYAQIKSKQMLKAGIGPTIAAFVLLILLCVSWHYIVFPSGNYFPGWAQ